MKIIAQLTTGRTMNHISFKALLLLIVSSATFGMDQLTEISNNKKRKIKEEQHYYFELLPAELRKKEVIRYLKGDEHGTTKTTLRNFLSVNRDLIVDNDLVFSVCNLINTQWPLVALACIGKPFATDNFNQYVSFCGKGSDGNILHRVCHDGDLEAVKDLVDLGVDPNERDNYFDQPALNNACGGQHTQIVATLLAAGANPNIQDADKAKMTPLFYAPPYMIPLLIEKGALINYQEAYDGNTPLHQSVINNNYHKAKMLLGFGADKTIKNKHGEDALMLAQRKNRTEILQLLEI